MHDKIVEILVSKIKSKKVTLKKRLAELRFGSANDSNVERRPERRFYPRVEPNQNPQRPFETWSGRGKQPRSVGDLSQSGKNIDDPRIAKA
jgi:DNA-binding protein H-NS